jgi:cysteine synthase A
MLNTITDIDELIGNQPLFRLMNNDSSQILLKLEYLNPSGSVKDRIALEIITQAQRRGELKPGATIIEPTTGNTGIAFAMLAAVKGYKMIAVMPEAVSLERRQIMELLGAKIEIVTCIDKSRGVTGEDIANVMKRAKALKQEIPNSYMPNQFVNMDNPQAHRKTMAREIITQTQGRFDAFVAAVGTGGTFSGVAEVLKKELPHIKCMAVEPATSAVLSGKAPGFHRIEGIGEGFIPDVMNTDLMDDVIQVTDEEAIKTTRLLWKKHGIMSGISGGANVAAAFKLQERLNPGNIIVTIIPDSGCRYFSTPLFDSANNF